MVVMLHWLPLVALCGMHGYDILICTLIDLINIQIPFYAIKPDRRHLVFPLTSKTFMRNTMETCHQLVVLIVV